MAKKQVTRISVTGERKVYPTLADASEVLQMAVTRIVKLAETNQFHTDGSRFEVIDAPEVETKNVSTGLTMEVLEKAHELARANGMSLRNYLANVLTAEITAAEVPPSLAEAHGA